MRLTVKLICTLALAMLWAVTPALADVPTEMNVQGRLTDGAGAPLPAGLKLFTFKIYDAPAGGTEIWPAGPGETQLLSTDANGLWNAGVGQVIPLTEAVFQSPIGWLEVRVDDGVNPPETLPRIELRTTPYTYRAGTSQQADSLSGVISSGQIVNEPGIAQGVNLNYVDIDSGFSMQDIVTTSITIPADGYIVVEASCTVVIGGTTDVNFIVLQIDEGAGGGLGLGTYTSVGSDSYVNSLYSYYPCSHRRSYFKAAGAYTFRLEALKPPLVGGGTRSVVSSTITATYFPTSYGGVSTVATLDEAGEFSSAALAPPPNPHGGLTTPSSSQSKLYYVDLRELELKSARAEAEAEKARRELIEAQLGAISKSSRGSKAAAQERKP